MSNNDLFAARRAPISVSELNRRARNLLEANLELMWVAGELSNVVKAASGHWYFSLKDDSAQVRCVMFRNKAALLGFQPENGLQVEVNALPSLYEARGEFQLGVETMRRAGLGALFEAFERLKAKLSREGLFDDARKKPLPAFPRRLGIVTSLKAAALRDVLTTLRRRAPMIEVILYPSSVQGAAAAGEIVAALQLAGERNECDALIVCRGGGSIEDLWPFNEEIVARAIAACPLPVVCGIGHETDFTIADFVGDRRAATPTAAAELLSPNRADLLAALTGQRAALRRGMTRAQERLEQHLDRARRGLVSPHDRLAREAERLRTLGAQLKRHVDACIGEKTWQVTHAAELVRARKPDLGAHLALLANLRRHLGAGVRRSVELASARWGAGGATLELLNPQRTLERGYSIAMTEAGIVRDSTLLNPGDELRLRFARGSAVTQVKDTDKQGGQS
jgi:exodeoxyribonuclease VII large subunit